MFRQSRGCDGRDVEVFISKAGYWVGLLSGREKEDKLGYYIPKPKKAVGYRDDFLLLFTELIYCTWCRVAL